MRPQTLKAKAHIEHPLCPMKTLHTRANGKNHQKLMIAKGRHAPRMEGEWKSAPPKSEGASLKDTRKARIAAMTDQLRALGALFVRLGFQSGTAFAAASLPLVDPTVRHRLETDLLTPGGAAFLLPVESLYKMWADPSWRGRDGASAFGASKHLYMGDPAHHVKALYERLEIDVPPEFAAMPDHLTLLCEVAALYGDADNHPALRTFLDEHLDWLGAYDAELADCAAALDGNTALALYTEDRLQELDAAIAHVRSLLQEVQDATDRLEAELGKVEDPRG